MKYRVQPDSVAGQPCVVIYDGEKPLLTIWDDPQALQHAARFFSFLTEEDSGELANLVKSIRALGGSREQLLGAIQTYLQTKLDEVHKKERK